MSHTHTPEPWFVADVGEHIAIGIPIEKGCVCRIKNTVSGEGINDEDRANAHRIVACVNACAGIPTDDLNEVTEKGMTIFNVCEAAEHGLKQRDTLLAALKASRATLERANTIGPECAITDTIWHTKYETLFDFMDETIASIESPTKEQPE